MNGEVRRALSFPLALHASNLPIPFAPENRKAERHRKVALEEASGSHHELASSPHLSLLDFQFLSLSSDTPIIPAQPSQNKIPPTAQQI